MGDNKRYPHLEIEREQLLQRVRVIDNTLKEPKLLVVFKTHSGHQSAIVPLVKGARLRKPYGLPEFATVQMDRKVHIVADDYSGRLFSGNVLMIQGMFAGKVGVLCICQIRNEHNHDELVAGILDEIPDKQAGRPFLVPKPMPEAPI